jgi:hypothetical protein
MRAVEAKEYGLIDEVLERKKWGNIVPVLTGTISILYGTFVHIRIMWDTDF